MNLMMEPMMEPIKGQMIGQMMGGNFIVDIIFNILFVTFSFIIFFKTKEMYELTKYRGIKYFRYSFLFLGLGYLIRALTGIFRFGLKNIFSQYHFPMRFFWAFPINFLGILAIFYLFLSIDWKFNYNEKNDYLIYILALLLSIIFYLTKSYYIIILFQILSLIVVVIFHIIKNRKSPKKMFITYSFLLMLWILNLFLIFPERIFSLTTMIIIQSISLIIMSYIFIKVIKWI
ncbi:MAG: hypothetical protein PHT94_03925 [Candidatus Nanoarchaeia archaeon]|nr:hypothetical protein [Candidatus Nanoarchaeia archaeon]